MLQCVSLAVRKLWSGPQGEGAVLLLFCTLTSKIPGFRVGEFNVVFCFGGFRWGGC